jgi:hypothetical protein
MGVAEFCKDSDERDAAAARAIRLQEEAIAREPDSRAHRQELASLLSICAEILIERGEVSDEKLNALCARAFSILEKLASESPDDPAPRQGLAYVKIRLGFHQLRRGNVKSGSALVQQEVDTLLAIADTYPSRPSYREEAITVLTNLGTSLRKAMENEAAVLAFEEA